MGERPSWAPPSIDISRPSAARVYDYFLGGSHNFAVDREVAEYALSVKPDLRDVMRENRAFLQRAVRMLAEQGITQFLDIGSGIPTVGNVHEVVHAVNPEATIVYCDHDPIAVAHAEAILRDNDRVSVLQADLRHPETILDDPRVTDRIDFDRPVGLLLVAVLHFVFDQDSPREIVARLRDAVAPGSYLAIEHATHDNMPAEARQVLDVWNQNSPEPMRWRTHDEITAFFDGFTVLDPGLVDLPRWRPNSPDDIDPNPQRFAAYCAVAHKPT